MGVSGERPADTAGSYDGFSKVLHWSITLLVLLQFATGWTWGYFERGDDARFYLFRTHLLSGYLILVLAVVRIMWRSLKGFLPLPPDLSMPVSLLARANHALLYAAILIQPLVGMIATTAFGETLGGMPNAIHITLAYVIAALVALHVAGAFWHQFVRRDGLLARMWATRST